MTGLGFVIYPSLLQCFLTNTTQDLFKKTPANTGHLMHIPPLLEYQYNISELSLARVKNPRLDIICDYVLAFQLPHKLPRVHKTQFGEC